MGADKTKDLTTNAVLFAGGVATLDSGGFTTGTDVRVTAAATTFDYLAIVGNGNNDVAIGTYTGNGLDDRSITLSDFGSNTPDLVLVMGDTANATNAGIAIWRTSTMVGDLSGGLGASLATHAANRIQAFGAGTFQVGSGDPVNQDTVVYYYIALRAIANLFSVVTYNGDGNDNRSITGAGFQPDNTLIKGDVASQGGIRFKDQAGDATHDIGTGGVATNTIQAVEVDGVQVGTSNRVNFGTGTPDYHAAFFKDGATATGGGGGGGQGGGRGGGNSGGGGGGGNSGGGPGKGGGGGPGPKKDSTVASKRRHRLTAGVL
jgi:hypothetical protein